jgi:uncharacterized protein (TIGR03790 family)
MRILLTMTGFIAALAQPALLDAQAFRVSPSASTEQPQRWMTVPRIEGRLTHTDIGLVINTADPYSVEVGEFYLRIRKLVPEQVLRVELPLRATLTPDEFNAFNRRLTGYFGTKVQGLALAWSQPYAVNCNSITGALALGYDDELCLHSCSAPLRRSPYFNAPTKRPFTDLGVRPAMLVAASDVDAAKALIQRGVAADRSLGWRGAPPAKVYFVLTSDRVRSVRAQLFPPPGVQLPFGIDVRVENADELGAIDHVLLYMTGLPHVAQLDRIKWVAGALADHLTSFGGALDGASGQMTALAWIASGATASYGTVSEPCSHLQKFPHPQVLLLHYLQGSTALEAYWKSVAWPQQGVFIGEPLAAPFSRD